MSLKAGSFKALRIERSQIPLTRRERNLSILLPPVISYLHLGIAQLNGEGYKRKAAQYWQVLLLRYAVLLLLVYAWAFSFRYVSWYAGPAMLIEGCKWANGIYAVMWLVRRFMLR